jgi:hypothetical protein
MAEPSRESMLRAETALVPFVRAFRLPVNPEDLEVMAYAVLRFGNSTEELPDIDEAVEKLIADHLAAHARMMDAMEASIRDRNRPAQTEGDGVD